MLIAVAVVGAAMLLMLLWFIVSPAFPVAISVLDSVAADVVVAVAFRAVGWRWR